MSTFKTVHRFYDQEKMVVVPLDYNIDTVEGMKNAVAWQLKLFSTIRDGGVWLVPRSGTAYTVHHAKKTVVRRLGFAPEPDIERVIRAAGWTVLAMRRAS